MWRKFTCAKISETKIFISVQSRSVQEGEEEEKEEKEELLYSCLVLRLLIGVLNTLSLK